MLLEQNVQPVARGRPVAQREDLTRARVARASVIRAVMDDKVRAVGELASKREVAAIGRPADARRAGPHPSTPSGCQRVSRRERLGDVVVFRVVSALRDTLSAIQRLVFREVDAAFEPAFAGEELRQLGSPGRGGRGSYRRRRCRTTAGCCRRGTNSDRYPSQRASVSAVSLGRTLELDRVRL